MENFVNVKLFTIPNIIAVGSIIIFWSLVGYTLNKVLTANNSA